MRLVYIILIACFIALVTPLVILFRPAPGRGRASAIDEAMQQQSPAIPGSVQIAPSAGAPKPDAPTAAQAAAQPAAALTLTGEHDRQSVTHFDRALLFLAPAAPSPMIEQPIATAAARPVVLPLVGPTSVPDNARSWRGVVLVPKNMLLATAHTSKVRIPRIEAHPLEDGNVRIWARIQNPSKHPVEIGIACTFRLAGQKAGFSRGFLEIEIPPGGYYDADFLSPQTGVETYTILVRSL